MPGFFLAAGKTMKDRPHVPRQPFFEILFVVVCVLLAEWAVYPLFGNNFWAVSAPVAAAFILMIISHLRRGESLKDLGFRTDNFLSALKEMLWPMAFFTLALVLCGWFLGSMQIFRVRLSWSMLAVYPGLFLWGLLQQYPLQAFINRRAQIVLGEGRSSVVFVSSIFALLHLPNLPLMGATFVGGLLWARTFQREPNLPALAFSHSLMTIVLVLTVPYSSLHGLRVGYKYFL